MSKLILYDFKCPRCECVFDDLVKSDIIEAPCPECNSNAVRLVSTPRFDPRMGVDSDFSTMGDKWARVRKQRAKEEKAHYKEHGTDMTPGADTQG